MDEIEFDEPVQSVCECCGAVTTRLTRFVSRDGRPFAIYYAAFADGPIHNQVDVLAGFGEWGENSRPERRVAFAFRLRADPDRFVTGIVSSEDAPWTTTFLGQILQRDEALKHPLIGEVFALSDHIIQCDRPIADYLEGRPA